MVYPDTLLAHTRTKFTAISFVKNPRFSGLHKTLLTETKTGRNWQSTWKPLLVSLVECIE